MPPWGHVLIGCYGDKEIIVEEAFEASLS
jgi:hypothetical protein